MVRPEETVYKDLLGDRKAQLRGFVMNPKDADPVGSDRTPEEFYINKTDKLAKYFDGNLDLRYAVPGIFKDAPPGITDTDYLVGQEWTQIGTGRTWKLLDKIEAQVLGSVAGSTNPNPSQGNAFPVSIQSFIAGLSGSVTTVRLLVIESSIARSLSMNLQQDETNILLETAFAPVSISNSPQIIEFEFSSNILEKGEVYQLLINGAPSDTLILERDEDLINASFSVLEGDSDSVLDLAIEITIDPGVVEATWVELALLIPDPNELIDPNKLILVEQNLNFVVDFDIGNDANDGSADTPFKTIGGAIAAINSTYDFNNGNYNYTLNVVSLSQTIGQTRIEKPVGAVDQQFTIQGANPDTELILTASHCFVFSTDFQVKIKNFKFVGSAGKISCIFGSKGRAVFEDNTITGIFNNLIFESGTFRFQATNNTIEDLSGTNFVRASYRTDYFQNGEWLAKGVNSFTNIFNLTDFANASLNNAASLALDVGATVSGRKFTKFNSTNINLATLDQLANWGDQPGDWYGSGNYRRLNSKFTYSHWTEGLAISLNAAGNLELTAGEILVLRNQGDKSNRYWSVNTFESQSIPFPAILTTQSEAYVYAADNKTIELLAVPPDPANLQFRVCLGKISTIDNSTIDTVEPLITERSPEFLDSFASPGAIQSCVIANAAMNNLNNSLVGTNWVFDITTFSTSSTIFSADAEGVNIGAAGTYRADLILNSSVPATGAQRPSVAIKIAVNGVEKLVAGRSGYIRRAGTHYRASSTVFSRLVINPGDKITAIGLRDAAGGVVDAPAGQSELLLTKLT